MSKKLATDWTKHLSDPEAKANFEMLVRNSVQVLSRLRDMIEEKQNNLLTAESRTSDYDNPSWAYKQADRNGRFASLKEVDQYFAFLS